MASIPPVVSSPVIQTYPVNTEPGALARLAGAVSSAAKNIYFCCRSDGAIDAPPAQKILRPSRVEQQKTKPTRTNPLYAHLRVIV